MQVEVRLFAGLRAGRFKKRDVELADGTSLGGLLGKLGIPAEEVALPLVNGQQSQLNRELGADDVVSVFPAVGGG